MCHSECGEDEPQLQEGHLRRVCEDEAQHHAHGHGGVPGEALEETGATLDVQQPPGVRGTQVQVHEEARPGLYGAGRPLLHTRSRVLSTTE
jgi:hypothetical protein